MLRGYDREIVDAINSCVEVSTFVPALGYTFARNPVEIEIVKCRPEIVALDENGPPTQSGLKTLQTEFLKQAMIVVER